MNDYDYDFDELRPFPGLELLAYGTANVIYSTHKNGVSVDCINAIWLEPTHKGADPRKLERNSELFKAIERVLMDKYSGHIEESINRMLEPLY
jgi:hypothetical protein